MSQDSSAMPAAKSAQTLPGALRALADEIEKGAPVRAAVVLTDHGEKAGAFGVMYFGLEPLAGQRLMHDASALFLERSRIGAPAVISGSPLQS